jgi:hypothetical protein
MSARSICCCFTFLAMVHPAIARGVSRLEEIKREVLAYESRFHQIEIAFDNFPGGDKKTNVNHIIEVDFVWNRSKNWIKHRYTAYGRDRELTLLKQKMFDGVDYTDMDFDLKSQQLYQVGLSTGLSSALTNTIPHPMELLGFNVDTQGTSLGSYLTEGEAEYHGMVDVDGKEAERVAIKVAPIKEKESVLSIDALFDPTHPGMPWRVAYSLRRHLVDEIRTTIDETMDIEDLLTGDKIPFPKRGSVKFYKEGTHKDGFSADLVVRNVVLNGSSEVDDFRVRLEALPSSVSWMDDRAGKHDLRLSPEMKAANQWKGIDRTPVAEPVRATKPGGNWLGYAIVLPISVGLVIAGLWLRRRSHV